MNLLQLYGVDNCELGLLSYPDNLDNDGATEIIEQAFKTAKKQEDDLEDDEEEVFIFDVVEEILSEHGIIRVYVDGDVFTDVL